MVVVLASSTTTGRCHYFKSKSQSKSPTAESDYGDLRNFMGRSTGAGAETTGVYAHLERLLLEGAPLAVSTTMQAPLQLCKEARLTAGRRVRMPNQRILDGEECRLLDAAVQRGGDTLDAFTQTSGHVFAWAFTKADTYMGMRITSCDQTQEKEHMSCLVRVVFGGLPSIAVVRGFDVLLDRKRPVSLLRARVPGHNRRQQRPLALVA